MRVSTLRYYAIESYKSVMYTGRNTPFIYREGAIEVHVFLEEKMVTVFYKVDGKVLAKDFTIAASWL